MKEIFPKPIRILPKTDIRIDGLTAYLSQSDTRQILFMEFEKDVEVQEHSHEAQLGIVLEGKIMLVIDDIGQTFTRGDRCYIPEGVRHSARIHAGYTDITFFNEPNRYSM